MAAPSTPRPPGCITPKGPTLSDDRYLELIQRIPIDYYEANTNFANGLETISILLRGPEPVHSAIP
jgi:hypothetical protein